MKLSDFFIFDQKISNNSELIDKIPKDALSIYEVVKVIDGVPLFLEEHLDRLHHSAKLSEKKISIDDLIIAQNIHQLIEFIQIKRGRIKFSVYFHSSGNHFYVKQAEDIEITQNQYMRGVKIKSFNFERLNPEAKVLNLNFNQTVLEIKNQYDVFEVLLIKDFKKVTECSRSNIFFIKDNSIFKARSIDILSGITGMHVLNICKQNSIPVIEKDIYINDLNTFESAFITGTSPGILAVSKIDKQKYSVNNTIRQFISDHYFSSVDNYIQNIKLNKSLSLWKYS